MTEIKPSALAPGSFDFTAELEQADVCDTAATLSLLKEITAVIEQQLHADGH